MRKKENDLNKLKVEFQNMMIQNGTLTSQGKGIFDAIWSNAVLRVSLFPNLDYSNSDPEIIKQEGLGTFRLVVSQTGMISIII
ncbi:hypothetical protein [Dyadobacter diqingensis]|uniref:hypothetical protein n=1 Tax=Dyadobacter diqingensis TaxID=2938121 RepID=UPI0020C1960A|nr:hypothetical protein [Dyadobacter diqingensis]